MTRFPECKRQHSPGKHRGLRPWHPGVLPGWRKENPTKLKRDLGIGGGKGDWRFTAKRSLQPGRAASRLLPGQALGESACEAGWVQLHLPLFSPITLFPPPRRAASPLSPKQNLQGLSTRLECVRGLSSTHCKLDHAPCILSSGNSNAHGVPEVYRG